MNTKLALQRRVCINQRLRCRATSCESQRFAVSPFCKMHSRRVERHGHPEGRAVHPQRDYGLEHQLVARFIKEQRQHPAIVCALAWLQGWLDHSTQDDTKAPARQHMQRLAGHGVTATDILTEAAALVLLARWKPQALSDDVRLDFAIGSRVLALAPLDKRHGGMRGGRPRIYSAAIGKVARRTVGNRIRSRLAALFTNMVIALEAQELADRQRRKDLEAPFINPPHLGINE